MASENYKKMRSFLGVIGSLEGKDGVLTELKYMLKYRLGIEINDELYNDDNDFKINTEELLKSDRKELQILSLMISTIDKCDKTLHAEKLFFDHLTVDNEKDIVATKCLYLLIKTFLQAYFEGELDKFYEDTQNLTHIFMTHNPESSKWLDDTGKLESSSFSPHYRRFRESFLFDFFDSGKGNKSNLGIIPIFVRFHRSAFLSPKPLMTRKPIVKQSAGKTRNSRLQRLIENKMRSERADEREDIVITSHDMKKYCKTWNEQILAQCGNNYRIYMEWFLKKYSEVDMDDFKKKCQNRYHDCVNDYLCERFFHFSFVNKLITSSLPLERVEKPELFMPLVMTENPYVIDIYFNLLTKSYEEEKVLRFDSNVSVNSSLNSHIENISKFVDYMNRVYNPALYFTFLEMLNKHEIKLSDVNTLFDCLDTIDKGQEIQSSKIDSKVKDLLERMRNIKKSFEYCRPDDTKNHLSYSQNISGIDTVNKIIYLFQRIYDYSQRLQFYFYCDNALKVNDLPSKAELLKIFTPYENEVVDEKFTVDELLKNDLNDLALQKQINDFDTLVLQPLFESKPKSNPSHHPTPKSNDESPQ